MSDNDRIILDEILKTKKAELGPGLNDSDFFELFSCDKILARYDLSFDDIVAGQVGSTRDGGIDGLFLFINGEIIEEDTDLSVYKKDITVELCIIQAKRSPSFAESPIQKLRLTSEEILSLSAKLKDLLATYNKTLVEKVEIFQKVYKA